MDSTHNKNKKFRSRDTGKGGYKENRRGDFSEELGMRSEECWGSFASKHL